MPAPRAIYWGRAASRDLAGIGRHIARDSPDNAHKLVLGVTARVQLLATNPLLGHASAKAGRRVLVVHRHHLVFYRLLPDGIHILRVKHSARMQPC